MVRSSGHHRKRSLSRSLSPSDHKRVKSSHRDREKERSRRRSRSRDRLRRSRSRDRKTKEKRPSESRVRSKPLKLKRRSRSRSRSRSREHAVKKEEKKEVKADDEPFDPTNLDKPKSAEENVADEDWIVTDMVQENSLEEDNAEESVQDNGVDENSFVSNRIFNETQDNREENSVNDNEGSETLDHRSDSKSDSESLDSHNSSREHKVRRKVSFSSRKANGIESQIFPPDHSVIKLIKNKIDLEMKQVREFHQLRIKNEIEKHNAEMKLVNLQMEYWLLKRSKSSADPKLATESTPRTCTGTKQDVHEVTEEDQRKVCSVLTSNVIQEPGTSRNTSTLEVTEDFTGTSTVSHSVQVTEVTGTSATIDYQLIDISEEVKEKVTDNLYTINRQQN